MALIKLNKYTYVYEHVYIVFYKLNTFEVIVGLDVALVCLCCVVWSLIDIPDM